MFFGSDSDEVDHDQGSLNIHATKSSQLALNQLGWHAFERLCGSILSECWGQTYQTFSRGPDKGRDGSFFGTWTNHPWINRTYTVQCKHLSGERRPLRKSDIECELPKIRRLSKIDQVGVYVLLTNAIVTGNRAKSVEAAFRDAGANDAVVYGADWIEQKIRESPRLRSLVPSLYGIGDLSQILDNRAYDQAAAIVESLATDFSRFVSTRAHRTAVDALDRHHFVMLLGEPAAGKSTIAHAIALSAIDSTKARLIYVSDVSRLVDHWNPHESQVFILDDVFGSTQFRPELAEEWNRHALQLRASLKNCQLICTSRDYVFRRASEELKSSAFPLINKSQVIVDVGSLSGAEKTQILYNHVKMGDLSQRMKSRLKPQLPLAVSRSNFKPETARRLGTTAFVQNLQISSAGIAKFFDSPQEFLIETIASMGQINRAALIALFASGGHLPCPIGRKDIGPNLAERLEIDVPRIRIAFSHLQDSFVSIEAADTGRRWRFRHPTLQEAIGRIVRDDHELLDVYVTASPLKSVLREVSCGISAQPGAELAVPIDLYPHLVERLSSEIRAIWFDRTLDWRERSQRERAILAFLSHRCSREFLAMFLSNLPGFVPRLVRVGSNLNCVPGPILVSTLDRFDLFDANSRAKYVNRIGDLAVETPDPGWNSVPAISDLLTNAEKRIIRERIKEELIPKLDSIVHDVLHQERENADTAQEFHDGIRARVEEFEEIAAAVECDIESHVKLRDAAIDLESLAIETDDEFEFDTQGRISNSSSHHSITIGMPESFEPDERSVFSDVDQ